MCYMFVYTLVKKQGYVIEEWENDCKEFNVLLYALYAYFYTFLLGFDKLIMSSKLSQKDIFFLIQKIPDLEKLIDKGFPYPSFVVKSFLTF